MVGWFLKRSNSESYYFRHRSARLAYAKRYYLAHHSEIRARQKCRRLRNLDSYRKRELDNCRRWRKVNRDKCSAIKFAQNHFPLGGCCEFCGSKDDLMRFLPDYNYPKIVVTVCRDCRGWIRRQRVLDW
jgi:hypothetical protein